MVGTQEGGWVDSCALLMPHMHSLSVREVPGTAFVGQDLATVELAWRVWHRVHTMPWRFDSRPRSVARTSLPPTSAAASGTAFTLPTAGWSMVRRRRLRCRRTRRVCLAPRSPRPAGLSMVPRPATTTSLPPSSAGVSGTAFTPPTAGRSVVPWRWVAATTSLPPRSVGVPGTAFTPTDGPAGVPGAGLSATTSLPSTSAGVSGTVFRRRRPRCRRLPPATGTPTTACSTGSWRLGLPVALTQGLAVLA